MHMINKALILPNKTSPNPGRYLLFINVLNEKQKGIKKERRRNDYR